MFHDIRIWERELVKSEGYSRAVENLEIMANKTKAHMTQRDFSTIQYNIFLLKMQPQYCGIDKQKETS